MEKKFFTRHGKVTVVETNGDKATVMLENGTTKVVAVSSLREKAVTEDARSRYPVCAGVKTASGKPSIGVDDEITDALRGLVPAELNAVYAENKYDPMDYKHLNPGMRRMTLGNLLRGRARNGKTVIICGKTIVE